MTKTRPLDGIRVIDFSRVLAGPLVGQILGDLGADVIKIERPGHGDDTRTWGPPWDPWGTGFFALRGPGGLQRARGMGRT